MKRTSISRDGRGRSSGRRLKAPLVAAALISVITAVVTTQSGALTTVTMRVIVEEVSEQGCTDNLDGSDFYADITVAGVTQRFGPIDDEDDIAPNWTVERFLDVDATSPAPVTIDIRDDDDTLNFDDDICDISGGGGTALNLSIPLVPCSVTGDVTGACGTSLTSTGNGDGDGNAFVKFRIEVDEPPAAPGLTVRCIHTPLWPQSGDDVTITVESLDGMVEIADGINHAKIADTVEIWVNDQSAPALSENGRTTASFTVNDVPAGDLLYGCRVRDDGVSAFTGWRRTRVGPPAEGKAIPVIYTGDRNSRVDIVFIADEDSYTSATDPAFLSDVHDVLKGAYYGRAYFLANQDKFNFWLADQTGDADSVTNTCMHVLPANWAADYSWRDSGVILHTNDFRDCAGSGVFSVEPTSLKVVLHESGHSPFGMADEYCCDGGYFENPPNPNLFDMLPECQMDAPALGRVAGDCRSFTDTRPNPDQVWSLSDPNANDLMKDNGPPQAGDIRRMDWFFTNCVAGQC